MEALVHIKSGMRQVSKKIQFAVLSTQIERQIEV
jgi:hypothetical protein